VSSEIQKRKYVIRNLEKKIYVIRNSEKKIRHQKFRIKICVIKNLENLCHQKFRKENKCHQKFRKKIVCLQKFRKHVSSEV